MHVIRRSSVYVLMGGQLRGPFNADLTLGLSLQTGQLSFHVSNRYGTFGGVAGIRNFTLGGPIRYFENAGSPTAGTGRFADIRSSQLVFKGVDDRVRKSLTITVGGELFY
jgi:hypothetical protein